MSTNTGKYSSNTKVCSDKSMTPGKGETGNVKLGEAASRTSPAAQRSPAGRNGVKRSI